MPLHARPAVLLAEHEPEVAELGRRYLTRAGAGVTITTRAEATIAALTGRTAAVAVLDLTMPGLDPRHLRRLLAAPNAAAARLPALFLLSAGMHPRDLRVAAESCLWRPFSPRLLVARVLAIVPPPAPAPAAADSPGETTGRTIGGLTLDPATRRARPAAEDSGGIAFTPAEFALLTALADHPGRVLTRDRLQAIVAQSATGHPVAGRAIDVHVSQVRAKLPDPALIRTVRGVGYVLDEPDPGAMSRRDG
ncbi:MAG TPA: response regulator transcription factor [Streptosporangiaceae bacterium]|nr:response regulator transcription factor [Streptosporangiaceae bacterium]